MAQKCQESSRQQPSRGLLSVFQRHQTPCGARQSATQGVGGEAGGACPKCARVPGGIFYDTPPADPLCTVVLWMSAVIPCRPERLHAALVQDLPASRLELPWSRSCYIHRPAFCAVVCRYLLPSGVCACVRVDLRRYVFFRAREYRIESSCISLLGNLCVRHTMSTILTFFRAPATNLVRGVPSRLPQ